MSRVDLHKAALTFLLILLLETFGAFSGESRAVELPLFNGVEMDKIPLEGGDTVSDGEGANPLVVNGRWGKIRRPYLPPYRDVSQRDNSVTVYPLGVSYAPYAPLEVNFASELRRVRAGLGYQIYIGLKLSYQSGGEEYPGRLTYYLYNASLLRMGLGGGWALLFGPGFVWDNSPGSHDQRLTFYGGVGYILTLGGRGSFMEFALTQGQAVQLSPERDYRNYTFFRLSFDLRLTRMVGFCGYKQLELGLSPYSLDMGAGLGFSFHFHDLIIR